MAKTAKKKKTIRSIPQQRTSVRELDPKVRVKNFEEVNCGYTLEQALNESERCLLCPDPACANPIPVTSPNQLRVAAGALGDFFGPGTTVGIPFAAQLGVRISF